MSPRSRVSEPPRKSTADAGDDLAMGLRAAYLTMHRRANAEFARFGLTADQDVILTTLAEEDEVTQKELVRRTSSDANTMSEMLGRLERRGLIARKRNESDARARLVSLTESGREVQRGAARCREVQRGAARCSEVQRVAQDGIAAFCELLAGFVPPDALEGLTGHLGQIAAGMTGQGQP